MEIGGIDITIPAKPNKDAIPIIISKMKEVWPNTRFQEHNSENVLSIDSAWVKDYAVDPPSIEKYEQRGFFIYKDADAALNWETEPSPEYNNTMLYFLIDSKHSDEHYITVVVDEENDFVNGLVKYFSEQFK